MQVRDGTIYAQDLLNFVHAREQHFESADSYERTGAELTHEMPDLKENAQRYTDQAGEVVDTFRQ